MSLTWKKKKKGVYKYLRMYISSSESLIRPSLISAAFMPKSAAANDRGNYIHSTQLVINNYSLGSKRMGFNLRK